MNIWKSAEKPKFRYELNLERERLGIYLECIEGEDHHDFHYFTVGLEFHVLWWFRRFGFYHFWYDGPHHGANFGPFVYHTQDTNCKKCHDIT